MKIKYVCKKCSIIFLVRWTTKNEREKEEEEERGEDEDATMKKNEIRIERWNTKDDERDDDKDK